MTELDTRSGAYSANVRMQLDIGGRVFVMAQLGPDFLILRDPAEHPPAEGEITLWIDEHVSRCRVWLPDGITEGKPETRIA